MTFADTVYGQGNTQTRLESDTADNLTWDRYSTSSESHSAPLTAALSRIRFKNETSPTPLHKILELAAAEVQQATGRTLVIVAGRSRRLSPESHQDELRKIVVERSAAAGSDSVSRTLGDVGAALVATSTNASLLVVQACLS